MPDHPTRTPGCWATIAALASVTRNIRLGTLVNCVLYRSAFEVARQAADVDRISQGRLIVGLGAGDDEQECRQLGITLPPPKERVRLLREVIRTVKGLWGESVPSQSSSAQGTLRPGPVQSPRIPILVAGLGRTTLRQVAEYADAVNFPSVLSAQGALAGSSADVLKPVDVKEKLAILETHCESLSRPLLSVLRTHTAPVVLAETPARAAEKLDNLPERYQLFRPFTIAGTAEHVIQAYQSLADAGISYFIAQIVGNDIETLDLLAERVRPTIEEHATKASTSVPTSAAAPRAVHVDALTGRRMDHSTTPPAN